MCDQGNAFILRCKARFSVVMLLSFVHVRFLILPGAQDTNITI